MDCWLNSDLDFQLIVETGLIMSSDLNVLDIKIWVVCVLSSVHSNDKTVQWSIEKVV